MSGLRIIRNYSTELTPGESKILRKIQALYSDCAYIAYLYVQPNLEKFSLKPDFIIIDPKRGLSIIEVKDWTAAYIRSFEKNKVILKDRECENPVAQTKKYYKKIKTITINDSDDSFEEIDDAIFANLIFTNLDTKSTKDNDLQAKLKDRTVNVVMSEKIRGLTIDDLFSDEELELDENAVLGLRGALFPESKIKVKDDESIEKIMAALDYEQESFARRLPYGHYLLTGVPGSGKTVILIARAIHLLKEHPDWNIRILTYNKSLQQNIESTLSDMAEKFDNLYNEGIFENRLDIKGQITVTTYHKLAMDISKLKAGRNQSQEWWDETLPQACLDAMTPRFDAVLIDEYQDFRTTWIKSCIKACKTFTYKNSEGKEVEAINLFMSGDRLQSIYNSKPVNWQKDFSLNMQGRSKLLKTSYRSGKSNVILALDFLRLDEKLKEEVETFYKDEADSTLSLDSAGADGQIKFIEGMYSDIAREINKLINEGVKPEDILVLCHENRQKTKLKGIFESEGIKESGLINYSTYFSSKGLEAKIVFLTDTENFTPVEDKTPDILNRKLLYVAMTRASEKLYIQASSFEKETFAKTIKELSL